VSALARGACVIALCLLSAAAHADRKAAEKYFQAGAKAYASQNFGAAAEYFDEAYKELPLPEIAFSAAQAYRRLYRVDPKGQYVRRSVELYRVYLDKVKTGGRVGDASDSLGEMQRELDKLAASGAKLRPDDTVERTRIGINITVTDQVTPDAGAMREVGEGTGNTLKGVTSKLDGKTVEPFALVEVTPGDHTVAVAADGYFPVEKKQRAVRGATSLVEVELRPKPARVTVDTESGARVLVDGRPSTTTTLELTAGKHVLAVVRNGREPFARELAVQRGQELRLAAPLDKTPRRRAVPWILGGAGALALVSTISGIAAVVADGKASDLRDQIAAGNASPGVGDDFDHQVTRRDELKTTALVFGGGALIAGAVGLGLYLFDAPNPTKLETKLQITPVLGSKTAGVAAIRRF